MPAALRADPAGVHFAYHPQQSAAFEIPGIREIIAITDDDPQRHSSVLLSPFRRPGQATEADPLPCPEK